MSDSKNISKNVRNITASGPGAVAIGGSVKNSVIQTNAHAEGATLADFLAVLKELRRKLDAAPLDPEIREDIAEEVQGIEKQTQRVQPSADKILGKVKIISDLVAGATQAGEKLVPLAQRLGELAAVFF